MSSAEQSTLLFILLIAILAPVVADLIPRVTVPGIVLEIGLGILIGPYVLGWAEKPGPVLEEMSRFGMTFLFFLAGMEIDFQRIRGRPLNLAIAGWLLSLALGLGIGWILQTQGIVISSVVLSVALTTTALGTLIPILRDSDEMQTEFGSYATAAGAIGEFGPIVLISVLLTADSEAETSSAGGGMKSLGLLAIFTFISIAAAVIAAKARPDYIVNLMHRTLHTSAQLPVRAAVLFLVALVVLTHRFGLDAVLGAIAAGLVVNLTCHGEQGEQVRHKLEAIGFGAFVPLFFVVSGIKFDLGALLGSPTALLRVPMFMLLFFIVRGLPVFLLYRRSVQKSDLLPLALLSGTALPLVVAVTEIALESGQMRPENAAALVGAGMATVLVYPLLALAIRPPAAADAGAPPSEVAA